MAKNKCPVCKLLNMRAELRKHLSEQTVYLFGRTFNDFAKDHKDIDKVCDEHRNPLKFNVCVTDLGETYGKIAQLRKDGVAGVRQLQLGLALGKI